jgi:hypothetical protein
MYRCRMQCSTATLLKEGKARERGGNGSVIMHCIAYAAI